VIIFQCAQEEKRGCIFRVISRVENVTFHLFDRREERLDERDAEKTTTTWIETTAIPMLIFFFFSFFFFFFPFVLSLFLSRRVCVCARTTYTFVDFCLAIYMLG
jgi:hypothetical protein